MPPDQPRIPHAKFVCEPIEPEALSADATSMGRGEPGLPKRFSWRGQAYEVARVADTWRSHGEDRGDVYVRKHWYDVVTTSGQRMRIYFDRNPQRSGSKLGRWWLYSVAPEDERER
jgi:hypothetical protein